ncbi:hypothetical protein [Leuconostoc pseudomesenteroides]|uniref:hypothetical protein n=1 Tax=Leuconostoc pseudomesenteroides TaxID=33968 RepID=UPI0032DF6DF8
MTKRKQKLEKYLKELNEFNWHHPEAYDDELKTQPIKNYQDYYLAQVALILVNNYLQSIEQVAELVDRPVATVHRLVRRYDQEFENLEKLKEAIGNGKDW